MSTQATVTTLDWHSLALNLAHIILTAKAEKLSILKHQLIQLHHTIYTQNEALFLETLTTLRQQLFKHATNTHTGHKTLTQLTELQTQVVKEYTPTS